MGNRPENTIPPLNSNLLRAIDLACNEDFAADRRWFFTDQEMREYLCGQRAAYANDTGVVRDRDGVIGTWYVAEMVAWTHTGPSLSEMADRLEMQDMPHSWQSDWERAFNREMLEDTEPLTDSLGEAIDAAMATLGHNRMVAKARERFINSGNTPDPMSREYDGDVLPCVGSDEGCQCEECSNLTEDEKMAQAGMSDEEITAVNHIDRIQDELDKARTCIGSLLGRIDHYLGEDMHQYAQTPSWYIEAAAISCGVVLKDDVVFDLGTRADWREEEMANAKAFDEALATAKERLNGLPF